MPLVAFLNKDEKKDMKATKIVYDCLLPPPWLSSDTVVPATLDGCFPAELAKSVLARWTTDLGFPE